MVVVVVGICSLSRRRLRVAVRLLPAFYVDTLAILTLPPQQPVIIHSTAYHYPFRPLLSNERIIIVHLPHLSRGRGRFRGGGVGLCWSASRVYDMFLLETTLGEPPPCSGSHRSPCCSPQKSDVPQLPSEHCASKRLTTVMVTVTLQ